MKRLAVPAVWLVVAASAFAAGTQVVGKLHAESGFDYRDVNVVVVANPAVDGMIWLNVDHSYPLLFAEGNKLADLVQTAAKKIDIATANKTSISYVQDIGGFNTENGALVTVSFQTDGYQSSFAVVHLSGGGNKDMLLLNRKDAQDFINVLQNAHGLVDDYQKQAALFQ